MNWLEVAKFLISITGCTAVVIYIGQKLLDKALDIGVERYKGALGKELESYKAEIYKRQTEHQIKFSKLHEERGEKIKDLYQFLYYLENKLIHLTAITQSFSKHDERQDAVVTHLGELNELLELNRIYFTDNLCLKIEKIISESKDITEEMYKVKLMVEHTKETHLMAMHEGEDYLDKWVKAESIIAKVKTARFELVDEFRDIIGVNNL